MYKYTVKHISFVYLHIQHTYDICNVHIWSSLQKRCPENCKFPTPENAFLSARRRMYQKSINIGYIAWHFPAVNWIGEDLRFDSSQRPAERQCFEGDVRAMRKGLAATGLLHRRFTTIFEIMYTITHPPSHPYLSDLFLLRYIHIHFLIDLAGRKKLQVLFSFFPLSHFPQQTIIDYIYLLKSHDKTASLCQVQSHLIVSSRMRGPDFSHCGRNLHVVCTQLSLSSTNKCKDQDLYVSYWSWTACNHQGQVVYGMATTSAKR